MRPSFFRFAVLTLATALGLAGCVAEAPSPDDLDEELEPGVDEQALGAAALDLVPLDTDVPTGNLSAGVTRLLTEATSTRALLGAASPTVDYSRNWLVAYRPATKTATSRVQVTRAQISASGKTLSVWATITEPGAGCAPYGPNELAVVRVPSRAKKPKAVRVYTTRATYACGLVQGGACTLGGAPCPASAPSCHGASFEAPGVCTKYPSYSGTSGSCRSDAACGQGGICAGLSTSAEGLCQAAWMRGTYSTPSSGQMSVPLPQGGAWHRLALRVTGQATVPMDAWVQVFADNIEPARVEWRLSNSTGTTSMPLRGTPFGAHVPVGVPGDESVNGEWILEVRDTGSGAPGYLRGARLSVTSRWD